MSEMRKKDNVEGHIIARRVKKERNGPLIVLFCY